VNGLDHQQGHAGGLRELELFAGAGGGILGSHLLGHRTVCAVEYNAYARSVLLARQNDGTFPPFPIWDDVRTFDGKPWRGLVDVVSGGFPCQDISIGGAGDGLDGERSGLWEEQRRIVGEIRPRYVRIENSPMLTVRGLDRVLADLAALGFDAEWGVLSAADTGAPHLRERIWILAHARCEHEQRVIQGIAYPQEWARPFQGQIGPCNHGFGRWPTERGMVRVDDGVAHRADRLKAIGNGQVPRVAAAAWRLLA
jgi:DNA (cytosine-5)-methyltransferase 1